MKGKIPFLILAILGIGVDLGTKALAFHHLPGPTSRIEVVDAEAFKLDWHHVENSGGMFGVGQGHGGSLRYFRLVALGIVVFFFLRADARLKLFMTSLAMILAGAVGNLYDSFFNGGKVRDFIEVSLPFMPESVFGRLFDPWPTFNVADSLILIGAVMLVVQLFFDGKAGDKGKAGDAGPAAGKAAEEAEATAGDRA